LQVQVIRHSFTSPLSPFESTDGDCEIVKWGYHMSTEIQTKFHMIQISRDTALESRSFGWRDQFSLYYGSSTEKVSEVHSS
jgi:hypothetical protein